MSRLETSRAVPALFEFPEEPERQECWGRFLDLRPHGALLLCQARVDRGARLRLRFDLPGGGHVEGLEGDARKVRRDSDGYCRVELLWRTGEARERLHRALLKIFVNA
ncbi:hypothetical protein EPO15_02880 [bacterium]|nr:MAG: hypothetical protein EPO15_02880 [bacterium]